MKKLVFPLLVLVLILAACGNKSDSDKKEETKSYKLDSGKSLDIPKNPERIDTDLLLNPALELT